MKLNLGCGNDIQSGYINIDFREGDGRVIHDLTKRLPYKDGSVEEVRVLTEAGEIKMIFGGDIDKVVVK